MPIAPFLSNLLSAGMRRIWIKLLLRTKDIFSLALYAKRPRKCWAFVGTLAKIYPLYGVHTCARYSYISREIWVPCMWLRVAFLQVSCKGWLSAVTPLESFRTHFSCGLPCRPTSTLLGKPCIAFLGNGLSFPSPYHPTASDTLTRHDGIEHERVCRIPVRVRV